MQKYFFPNQITQHINKRSKTEDDKQKMELLKEDIFHKNLSIIYVFRKHAIKMIGKLTDLKTTKNISYFNFRSNMINKYVQKNLIDKTNIANYFMKNGLMYYNGLIIVCKKYYKQKDFILNVNFKYAIKSYGNFKLDEKNAIQQKNHRKKIKLTNEEIYYIVISNVNNFNIELKI